MPREATLEPPQVIAASAAGTLTVHPAFVELFAQAGLTCAAAFLELPGEVVSGHADRHVARVEVGGATFYLKRQHVVGWREKLRNHRAGFGWSSRCAREATLLEELEAAGLPAPRWAAFGTHGGRAFLLVEEVAGAVDLRCLLGDNTLSPAQRRTLATRLGKAIAAVHATGFSTPDLTAKHALVHPRTLAITFLDWPSATRGGPVDGADALGALHASLAKALASPVERMRVMRVYVESRPLLRGSSRPLRAHKAKTATEWRTTLLRAAARHSRRRSVRDQLAPAPAQRLVWLAGEAVCAIPEVAAAWPLPAVAPTFAAPGTVLVRGRSFAPFGRLRARLRATPWRSPGVTIGRVLFHLQRYGVPAPRLLAFGQTLTGPARAEWFALYDTPPGVPLREWRLTASPAECRSVFEAVARLLDALHAAGCVLIDAKNAFAVCGGQVSVADPRAVRIVRRVSGSARARDLRGAARLLGVA